MYFLKDLLGARQGSDAEWGRFRNDLQMVVFMNSQWSGGDRQANDNQHKVCRMEVYLSWTQQEKWTLARGSSRGSGGRSKKASGQEGSLIEPGAPEPGAKRTVHLIWNRVKSWSKGLSVAREGTVTMTLALYLALFSKLEKRWKGSERYPSSCRQLVALKATFIPSAMFPGALQVPGSVLGQVPRTKVSCHHPSAAPCGSWSNLSLVLDGGAVFACWVVSVWPPGRDKWRSLITSAHPSWALGKDTGRTVEPGLGQPVQCGAASAPRLLLVPGKKRKIPAQALGKDPLKGENFILV